VTAPTGHVVANEFAAVEVRVDTEANGARLHLRDIETGAEVYLDPLDLASLCLTGPRQREAWLRSAAYRPAGPDT
jgi:hypothetical protein